MTAKKQHPRLLRSGLSGRVYVVTRYQDLGDGNYEALEKFDVTEEFEAMIVERTQPVGSWQAEPSGDDPRA